MALISSNAAVSINDSSSDSEEDNEQYNSYNAKKHTQSENT